ncbi:Nin1 binding protein [Gonapodya sp. JEL0774]|nr:Nin1 binding protein [Gonapodya sp. JEL0774]
MSSTPVVPVAKPKAPNKTTVLDAGPLLRLPPSKLASLTEDGATIVTIPEVLNEVRDKRAKQNLEMLPVPIAVRNPSEEAFAAVTSFSKKTGDFSVLSVTDLKVLALTWMLEKEVNGIAHLRTAPKSPIVVNPGSAAPSNPQKTELARASPAAETKGSSPISYNPSTNGPLSPTPVVEAIEMSKGKSSEPSGAEVRKVEIGTVEASTEPNSTELNSTEPNSSNAEEADDAGAEDPLESESDFSDHDVQNAAEDDAILSQAPSRVGSSDDPPPSLSTETPATPSAADTSSSTPSNIPSSPIAHDTELDDGWITPANIHKFKAKAQPAGDVKVVESTVACMTADFAIQNVLLQMNLRLLSFDGIAITKIKTFVLRCHACFKITTAMDKRFCPTCGGNTLMRTTSQVDKNGNLRVFLKKNFQYNLRGTKYDVPMPKGGRNSTDLIRAEDQREYQKALKTQEWAIRKEMKSQAHFMDPDWVPDMFAEDVDRERALRQARSRGVQGPVIGFGKKNPNEARRGGGRKKR